MQANAEISHKVRLAIKTKLTELGAYVDDELPDYVLVMVANRRGRQDMKKELELFLGDATDRFCSWLFGVLDKLKDAKKTAKDKRPSESETDNGKADLADYDEEEIEKPKKKEETKSKKTSSKDQEKSKKSRRQSSPSPAKKIRKSRSKSPSKQSKSSRKKDKSRQKSKSVSRSRSRSRSKSKTGRKTSKDRKRNKSESSSKDSKKKKEKKRSSSSEERKKKEDEKSEIERREKAKKKAKESGGVKSSVVVPEKGKEKIPKPTSNLIIRAINESSSSGPKKLTLTRSITVTGGGAGGHSTTTLSENNSKTATKRKSKGGDDSSAVPSEPKKRNKQNDKRVFVTKDQEGNAVELEKPSVAKNSSKSNIKSGQSGGRASSPKFFVTLHDPNSKKEPKSKKKSSDTKNNDVIIKPDESDDSDTVPENDIAALSAAKIKAQQEANTAQLEINSILPQQSVSLNIGSLADGDPDARTIFVSGLDWTVGESELQEHFGLIGQIIRITVLKDRFTGCSKGCAYIQYATVEQKKMACEAFDKTDFHSKKISVGDKLPPGQIPQNYIARAAITANIPQKPTFPRPAKESKYSYVPGGPAAARSKYQWTKPGFMPPR